MKNRKIDNSEYAKRLLKDLQRPENIELHDESLKIVYSDYTNLTEDEFNNIKENYIKEKFLIGYNIRLLNKGKNLTNANKVKDLKHLKNLMKTIYSDINTYIAYIREQMDIINKENN